MWRSVLIAAALAIVVPDAALGTPAGVPDPGYGAGGVSINRYPGEAAGANVLLPTPGGLGVVGDSATTISHDGKVIIARLTSHGTRDPAFGSLYPSNNASLAVNGAVVEPSGRLVVATTGTPQDSYPFRIELLGFDSSGHLDPTFGSSGVMLLNEPGEAVGLFIAPDGSLVVPGSSNPGSGGLASGLLLARLSASGTELGATVVPSSAQPGDLSVSAASPLSNGSVILAGTEPQAFLARFGPDGKIDPSFGTGGIRNLQINNVQVDDVAVDSAGRMLISGAQLANRGRSVNVAVAPLLLRTSNDGTIDSSFAGGGVGIKGGEAELSEVLALSSGNVLAAAGDGAVLGFGPRGDPDLPFGIAGTSQLPAVQLSGASDLLLNGNGALLATSSEPPSGYDTRVAVERVLLQGSGLLAPRARFSVRLSPIRSSVSVRVPSAWRDQSLAAPIVAPILPLSIPIGDGATYVPVTTAVAATAGSVRVDGVGGSAEVTGGRFGLRSVGGKIAELDLSAKPCGHTTRFTLHGPFRVTAGRLIADNVSRTAVLDVTQPCGGRARVKVLAGRVIVRGPVIGPPPPFTGAPRLPA